MFNSDLIATAINRIIRRTRKNGRNENLRLRCLATTLTQPWKFPALPHSDIHERTVFPWHYIYCSNEYTMSAIDSNAERINKAHAALVGMRSALTKRMRH